MSLAEKIEAAPPTPPLLPKILTLVAEAERAAEAYGTAARNGVRKLVAPSGKVDPGLLEQHQFAAHGYAWIATYVAALRQIRRWAEDLSAAGALGELEQLLLQAAYGEYLAQFLGGLPMSQVETVRPVDLGISETELVAFDSAAVRTLLMRGNTEAVRQRIAVLLSDALDTGQFGALGLDDSALEEIRRQFRRFVEQEVLPHAHDWHLKDELIPLPVVDKMAELGVFGLTVPEDWGGLGLGKLAMCVVTEELSRGYIGVGSLGTRSEIAAELIRLGGTAAQKERWLPKIASGEILPTAVFTEPNTGSDLASLRTRATRDGDVYRVHGNKTWITHAARADVMTLLVRTDADKPGYQGLSMLLGRSARRTSAASVSLRSIGGAHRRPPATGRPKKPSKKRLKSDCSDSTSFAGSHFVSAIFYLLSIGDISVLPHQIFAHTPPAVKACTTAGISVVVRLVEHEADDRDVGIDRLVGQHGRHRVAAERLGDVPELLVGEVVEHRSRDLRRQGRIAGREDALHLRQGAVSTDHQQVLALDDRRPPRRLAGALLERAGEAILEIAAGDGLKSFQVFGPL